MLQPAAPYYNQKSLMAVFSSDHAGTLGIKLPAGDQILHALCVITRAEAVLNIKFICFHDLVTVDLNAKTALLALTALQLGKSGFKGHPDPLGGRGFLKMMTGREDIELKPIFLNGTYAIMKSYTKPYASCRYTHPSVEAAIHLRDKVKPEEVEAIEISTYDLAVSGHDHTEIPGSYSAKMSIPYATAAGLLYGKAGLQEFTEEAVRGDRILNLTGKIKVTADDSLSEVFPAIQAAIVKIHTPEGEFTERVDFPKGEPENPLTEEEFRDRYDGLMAYAGVDPSVSAGIYTTVHNENATADSLVKDL